MKQRISVLCAVRDDAAIRRLMCSSKDADRCIFRIAGSGTQALRAARECAPDVLITDAVLSGCDGLALIDRLKEMLGSRMPRVIGGSMMAFSDAAFRRRGVKQVVDVPWDAAQLETALNEVIHEIDTAVEWEQLYDAHHRACMLLSQLGMRSELHGYAYLSWAAALAVGNESRLYALGERIYTPIAEKYATTPQSVERLIRHALESTIDSAKTETLYVFFGNSIDPARGKPTNAQMIGMLAQRVRVEERQGMTWIIE